jgi:glutamate 5-kinase
VLSAAARIDEALVGRSGTLFHPAGDRSASRLFWLRHATTPRGSLVLDGGAVTAVVERRMSLLPAGVTGVRGDFYSGEPVDLVGPDGVPVARGLVGYDAADLPPLLGRSTRELARELGAGYEREVVHRDDLVLIERFAERPGGKVNLGIDRPGSVG